MIERYEREYIRAYAMLNPYACIKYGWHVPDFPQTIAYDPTKDRIIAWFADERPPYTIKITRIFWPLHNLGGGNQQGYTGEGLPDSEDEYIAQVAVKIKNPHQVILAALPFLEK